MAPDAIAANIWVSPFRISTVLNLVGRMLFSAQENANFTRWSVLHGGH